MLTFDGDTVDIVESHGYRPASALRHAVAVTVDAAVVVTGTMFVLRRQLSSVSVSARLVVPVAIQTAYFTITTAIAGGSPGQRLAGLRAVDTRTGGRATWAQSALRWVVWAGPGIVARIVIATFRRPSAKTQARSAILGDEQHRLDDELFEDPDELRDRLSALHSTRRTEARWVPSAVAVVLLVVYKLTVGRNPHDRLSGTIEVATR